MKKVVIFLFSMIACRMVNAQVRKDTANLQSGNLILLIPDPVISGTYFNLRSPDRKDIKSIELINSEGEKVNKTEITYSKMGFYMPKVPAGMYLLRIQLEEETYVRKIDVQ